ncbi:MAG: hypothetical protein C5B50_16525 [Verrucomicrobia bacterium]|nr:MAG: hypothetical protein C5B50_16525 [Verrucomicrobiota bacterium]
MTENTGIPKTLSTRHRFPELDLLRFLAACSVMLFHYTFRGPEDHAWPGHFPHIGQIFKYGYLGVDVFFILSGFVILLTAWQKDAVAFTIARMVRLYPAYWTCVTLTTVALLLAGNNLHRLTPGQYLANLTMLHSFFGIRDVSGVYWTLAVELKFYFIIFLVLAARQVQRIGYILGGWLLASILLSLGGTGGVARFFLFPQWSSYFIAGAMFFLVHRDGPDVYKLCVIALCYVISLGYALNLLPWRATHINQITTAAPVLVALLTFFYLVFLAISLNRRAGSSSSRVFYVLGLLTYPLYLIHQDIGYILLRRAPAALGRDIILLLVIAAIIGLSGLIHYFPEKWLAFHLNRSLLAAQKIAVTGLSRAGRRVRARGLQMKTGAPVGRVPSPGAPGCEIFGLKPSSAPVPVMGSTAVPPDALHRETPNPTPGGASRSAGAPNSAGRVASSDGFAPIASNSSPIVGEEVTSPPASDRFASIAPNPS